MLSIAAIILGLAVLGGAGLASLHLLGKPVPWAVSIGHGLLAAIGLIVLVIAAAQGAGGVLALWAIGLLVAAALGGVYMAFQHRTTQTRPTAVIAVHGLLAVSAFALVLVASFS